MLQMEDMIRLHPELQPLYRLCHMGDAPSVVATAVRGHVVRHFLHRGIADGCFNDIRSGLLFLICAVGNFPSHTDKLAAAARHVKFSVACTIKCPVPCGSIISGQITELTSIHDGRARSFGDVLRGYGKPTVLLMSSGS